MPRMTSSLETVQDRPLLGRDSYPVTIDKIEAVKSKKKDDGSGDNPMLNISYKVRGGQFDGALVPTFPDRIMIGGRQRKKDGSGFEPMNCFNLVRLIEAFHLPWGCLACGSGDRSKKFKRGSQENGLPLGKYFCPDCSAPADNITYDTDLWLGASGKVSVDVEKYGEGSDREINTVTGYSEA